MSWQDTDNDEADDAVDPEAPDESDQDPDDGPEVVPCPHCGKMIHEQSEWCHLCGKYISAEDRESKPPRWLIAGTVLGLLGLLGGMIAWLLL